MKTKHAIDRAGSATALASILGITSSAITQWGENVPKARVWQLRLERPEWFTKAGELIALAASAEPADA